MIRRHNLKQSLFIPVHLVFGILGYGVCWWLFTSMTGSVFEAFEPQLPSGIHGKRELVAGGIAWIAILAASYEGWKLWNQGITELPGLLSEVYPHSGWGAGAGSARFDMAAWSVEFRLFLNLILCGPLQLLAAWQRMGSRIPDTPETHARIEEWKAFAESQKGWHSESLYNRDETALERLIQMGFLDYSPTKRLVAVRNR